MRYLFAVLAVMVLVAAPVAVAGPDALSIAKRALRLAKEPPKSAQVHTSAREVHGREVVVRARCPRGMIAMGVVPELGGAGGEFVSAGISEREGLALFRLPESVPPIGPDPLPEITVTCIEG